jgi:hypothetical protein
MNGRVSLNFVLALVGIAFCVVFLLFLPMLAKAQQDKPVTHFLAIHHFKAPTTEPHILGATGDGDECRRAAAKLNLTNPAIKVPDEVELGAEFVCLAIERGERT